MKPITALEELRRVQCEFREAAKIAAETDSQGVPALSAMSSATSAALRTAADSLCILERMLCDLAGEQPPETYGPSDAGFGWDADDRRPFYEEEGTYSCQKCGGGMPAYCSGDGTCPDCYPATHTNGVKLLEEYLHDHPGWATRQRRKEPPA